MNWLMILARSVPMLLAAASASAQREAFDAMARVLGDVARTRPPAEGAGPRLYLVR
jgi:hypothetical protein